MIADQQLSRIADSVMAASDPCSPVKIRKALVTDVDEIYRIHTEAIHKKCSSHYTKNEVETWVERQNRARYIPFIEEGQIVVAESKEGVLGFGHIIVDTILDGESEEKPSRHALQIKGLFVDPGCKGVGSILMQHLGEVALARGAGALTVLSSLNAVEFYKKFGFVSLEVVSHQVSEQDCLQCMKMIKTL